MDAAAMGQVISAALSGAFGAGAASWIIKQVITRSFKKVDKLEDKISEILNSVNGISTKIALIEQQVGQLSSANLKYGDIEKNVIDFSHRIKALESADRSSLDDIKDLREHVVKLEREFDRQVLSKN